MEQLKPNFEKNSIEILGKEFEVDKDGFVGFRSISNELLFKDHQYASLFIKKFSENQDSPELGKGLRFQGNDSYSGMKIHKDDIEEFVRRVYTYRKEHDGFFKMILSDPDSEATKIANML